MKHGKLMLKEVGSRSYSLKFSESDLWVLGSLERAAPHPDLVGMEASKWAQASKISGDFRIERLNPEYSLAGKFTARLPLLCPRCGGQGYICRKSHFRLFLRPLGSHESADDQVASDPDYVFLETPYIDLAEILCEQIVAAEELAQRPQEELDGGPHQCSAASSLETDLEPCAEHPALDPYGNGEGEAGQAGRKAGSSPFEVLGQIKGLGPATKSSKKAKV